jgi:hypothetical protein
MSAQSGQLFSLFSDIKLDKVLPPDCQLTATSIATAWDFFERPLSDLFDQANNLAGWTLQSLDNGVFVVVVSNLISHTLHGCMIIKRLLFRCSSVPP